MLRSAPKQSIRHPDTPHAVDRLTAPDGAPPTHAAGSDANRQEPPLLLRGSEAAALLNVGRSKFYAMNRAGQIPRAVRFDRLKLWSRLELIDWVRDGCPVRHVWEARKR